MKAYWRVMMEGAREEAMLAVDLYNQPKQARRLEAFLVHMHLAWLYLLHAEFRRDGVDYRYKLANGRLDRVDGEPKTWDLQRSLRERWPDSNDPVRANLELTVGLRNKIEHRYEDVTALVTSGYAQSLIINFERELVAKFGGDLSLASQLRFPLFVGDITGLSAAEFKTVKDTLPKKTRDFLARFESGLADDTLASAEYEFRVNLIPKTGAKTDVDRAFTFVREADLTEEERKTLEDLGKAGKVVVREQQRSIVGADMMKPKAVAAAVQDQIPFRFGVQHVVDAWRKLGCRPPTGDAHPERTDEKYCIYDKPHRDYVYTEAFVKKLVREAKTEASFRSLTGREPVTK